MSEQALNQNHEMPDQPTSEPACAQKELPQKRSLGIAGSSWGDVYFDLDTGIVDRVEAHIGTNARQAGELERIYAFDVDEFRRVYPDRESNGLDSWGEIDILDIGFWETTTDGVSRYEPAAEDYRSEAGRC